MLGVEFNVIGDEFHHSAINEIRQTRYQQWMRTVGDSERSTQLLPTFVKTSRRRELPDRESAITMSNINKEAWIVSRLVPEALVLAYAGA
jgi:hypothetical protein